MSFLPPDQDQACDYAFSPVYSIGSPSYSEVSSCSESCLTPWSDSFSKKGTCMLYNSTPNYQSCPSFTSSHPLTTDSYGCLDGLSSISLVSQNQDGDDLHPTMRYLSTSTNWINNPHTFSNNNFLQSTQQKLPLFDDLISDPQFQFCMPHQAVDFGSIPDSLLSSQGLDQSSPILDSNIFSQNFTTQHSPKLNILGSVPELEWNYSGMCLLPTHLSSEKTPTPVQEEEAQTPPAHERPRRVGRPRKYGKFLRGKTIFVPGSLKKCDFEGCGKKFVRQEHLKRHQRTHTNAEPWSCKLCKKSFSRFDNMVAHVKLHRRGSQDRPNRRTQYFESADQIYEDLTRDRRRISRLGTADQSTGQ